MKEFEKIHILSQELIPVFEDLDDAAKKVILEHIERCTHCHSLYENQSKEDDSYIHIEESEPIEIKPLKKLVQFNQSLKGMLFFIRATLLIFIVVTSLIFYDWQLASDAAVIYIKMALFLFYFPSIIFLNVFTIVFFNRKWIWISILTDIIIILFFDTFITMLI